jgi:uncharacterized protein with beta-barrel porin domain
VFPRRTETTRPRGRLALIALLLATTALPAAAQDATWLATPATNELTDFSNWTPFGPPFGTAFFGASTKTSLTLNGAMIIGGWTFAAGAPAYSVAIGPASLLAFQGAGIGVNGGSVAITNSGLMIFQNSSSAGAATITNNNILNFWDSSSAGSATITNNLTLQFRISSTAGNAAITNNRNLTFYEDSTAGSATIINSRNLIFNGSSTAGSATITNSGTLASTVFSQSSTAGNAIITNNKSLGFYENSTAGSATIINNADLIFYHNATTGSATITTSGLMTMRTVDTAGAATVTVQSGGVLTGFGAVGNTTIQSGGTFAPVGVFLPPGVPLPPGYPLYPLTVNGNLTLNAGATYRFDPTGLAAVTGTATLGGANLVYKALSFQDQTYTVMTYGSRTGTFTSAGDGAVGTILYGTNDVTLTVKGYRAGTALSGQGGTNAASIAAIFDKVIDATGAQPTILPVSLIGITGANLAKGIGSLSGETATGTQSTAFSGSSTFLNIMLDPMAGARGATAAAPGSSLIEMADTAAARTPAARVEAGWSVWTKAYGQAGRTASDAGTGAAGTGSQLYGVAAGADRMISADTLVGFALAGGGSNFGLTGRGSGTGDFFQAGLYGSTRLWDGYVSAAAAYGWNRYDVSRTVTLGITET